MNIIFFGNTKYSVIVAETLHKNLNLKAIVTIPDQPAGRKQILTPTPTKTFAQQNNIPVIEADKLDSNILGKIKILSPDFLVVADYGLLLPKSLLDIPKYAPLNVHHSLLPKYRGPSPVPTTILNGEKISGITIIKMNEALDAGDILAQEKYILKTDETTDSLLTTLNTLGGKLTLTVINDYINGKPNPVPQDESKTTFTKHFEKNDGFIDLNNPPSPEKLDRMIRAYHPWPSVWTKLKINDSGLKIIKLLPNRMIQVEGKNPTSYKDFVNGYPNVKDIIKIF